MASVVGAEVVAAEEVLVADGITTTIRASGLRLFGFDSLSSPLERRRGRGHCCSGIRPEAIAAAVSYYAENEMQPGDNPPDRKSTRLNSSHITRSRMPSSA